VDFLQVSRLSTIFVRFSKTQFNGEIGYLKGKVCLREWRSGVMPTKSNNFFASSEMIFTFSNILGIEVGSFLFIFNHIIGVKDLTILGLGHKLGMLFLDTHFMYLQIIYYNTFIKIVNFCKKSMNNDNSIPSIYKFKTSLPNITPERPQEQNWLLYYALCI